MEEFFNLYSNNAQGHMSSDSSDPSMEHCTPPTTSSALLQAEEQLSSPKEMEGEEFASTAFRIPKEGKDPVVNQPLTNGNVVMMVDASGVTNESSIDVTKDDETNAHPETEQPPALSTTTLHFESGLSLPISNKSVSNKKVIATKEGKQRKERSASGTTTPLPHQSLSSWDKVPPLPTTTRREGNDVHNHMIFSALDVVRTCKSTDKNVANHSKKTKNSTNDPILHSLGDDFFGHVRVAFTEAMNTSASTATTSSSSKGGGGGGKAHHDKKPKNHKSDVEFLTLDPVFLNQRCGEDESLKFLREADSIIGCELQKLKFGGTIADGDISNVNINAHANHHHQGGRYFLNDRIHTRSSSRTDEVSNGSVPEWMQPFVNDTSDQPIRLLLILLAHIEQAIRKFHKQHVDVQQQKLSMDKNRNNMEPPSLPSFQKQDEPFSKQHQHLDTSEEFCKPFMLKSKNDSHFSTILTDVFKTWKSLHVQKEKDDAIISKIRDLFRSHLTGKRLKTLSLLSAEDLVLVPLSSVCTIKEKGETSGTHVEAVVAEWNRILETVFQEAKADLNQIECKDASNNWHATKTHFDEIDMFDDSLFANDDVKKPGNGKKKKKKKKKKVR